jgi:hypothetical protein
MNPRGHRHNDVTALDELIKEITVAAYAMLGKVVLNSDTSLLKKMLPVD